MDRYICLLAHASSLWHLRFLLYFSCSCLILSVLFLHYSIVKGCWEWHIFFWSLDLIRPGHCWNGIAYHDFVDIVERKQSQWKLGGGSNVRMSCAKRGFTLVLIQYAYAQYPLLKAVTKNLYKMDALSFKLICVD